MKPRLPHIPAMAWTVLLALLAALWLTWSPPLHAATSSASPSPSDLGDRSRALQRARNAVVGLRALAVDGARSSSTLGRQRQGSGVVIGRDNLVLTIGYLVLEADQVLLLTEDDRSIPAQVLGYDIATGFGLVQALAPLRIEPVPLGKPGALSPRDAMMVASGGEEGAVSPAWLVSRRAFSGYWEYHINGALFTTPPRGDHSGAGLFNAAGELVGIGSLVVADAAEPDHPQRIPGNMFVPVDLLAPILDELRRAGSTAASRRAWIGVNCVEHEGGVRVIRVNDDSPAELAGIRPGDRILRVDGADIHALDVLWQALWRGPVERELQIEVQRDGRAETLKVFSIDRMKTLKRPQGI